MRGSAGLLPDSAVSTNRLPEDTALICRYALTLCFAGALIRASLVSFVVPSLVLLHFWALEKTVDRPLCSNCEGILHIVDLDRVGFFLPGLRVPDSASLMSLGFLELIFLASETSGEESLCDILML